MENVLILIFFAFHLLWSTACSECLMGSSINIEHEVQELAGYPILVLEEVTCL